MSKLEKLALMGVMSLAAVVVALALGWIATSRSAMAAELAPSRGTPAVSLRPTIGLDAGQNFTTTRRMAGGGEFLNYEIYKEAARTNVWGNSGAALINHTPTGPPNAQTYPTYGRVPRGQDVTPATYTDSVVATVIF